MVTPVFIFLATIASSSYLYCSTYYIPQFHYSSLYASTNQSYRHKVDSKYLSIQHVYCTLCVSEIMQSAGDTAPTSSSVPAFNLCLQQCLNHPHFFR